MERSFMKREEKALEKVVNDGPLVSVSVVSPAQRLHSACETAERSESNSRLRVLRLSKI